MEPRLAKNKADVTCQDNITNECIKMNYNPQFLTVVSSVVVFNKKPMLPLNLFIFPHQKYRVIKDLQLHTPQDPS